MCGWLGGEGEGEKGPRGTAFSLGDRVCGAAEAQKDEWLLEGFPEVVAGFSVGF